MALTKLKSDYPSGIWFGVGATIQSQVSVLGWGGGAGSMLSFVCSADQPLKNMVIKFSWGNEKGLSTGLGISEEIVMVLITSLHDPYRFYLTEPLGVDMQLDAGAVVFPATKNLQTVAHKMRGLGLKNVRVDNLRFLSKQIESLMVANDLSTLDFRKTERPELHMIPTTVGLGLGVGRWTSTAAAVQVVEYPQ